MTKIHIVQIAYMGEEYSTEYLDSCGRVWIRVWVAASEGGLGGYYEWHQLELPDDPSFPEELGAQMKQEDPKDAKG